MNQIVALWDIEQGEIKQIHPSAWEVSGEYVLKVYEHKGAMERNIQILKVLHSMDIPVAEVVSAADGGDYVSDEQRYYMMTRKLPGDNLTDIRTVESLDYRMGEIIAQLHLAFQRCEEHLEFSDKGLLGEMTGWVKRTLMEHQWNIVTEAEFTEAVEQLEMIDEELPRQLIHRDVHFGNFLFEQGGFSGYIDFDLSQRNIRIFDLCYFVLGLLIDEEENGLSSEEWIHIVSNVAAGYESRLELTEAERKAIPCVMKNIELLFVAYFSGLGDEVCAGDAARIYRFVGQWEAELGKRLELDIIR